MENFRGLPIVSDQLSKQELQIIFRELSRVLLAGVPGDVVELGCYQGTSAIIEADRIRELTPSKQLWLYDSFEGLPNKTAQDLSPVGQQFKAGELRTGKDVVVRHFRRLGLPLPKITKAWFKDLKPSDLPPTICFALLDGDFYESITDSLRLVWPKLAKNAVVMVDDYYNESLPGASKAVHDWLNLHPARIQTEASLAIIRP